MEDSEFEWHDPKAASNLADHGISFDHAKAVFRDTLGLDFLDTREDYGEERSIRIGRVEGAILTVCYTERGSRKRLISARYATKSEKDGYFKQEY
jgi:uncharacterized DUF497 family protein